MDLTFQTKKQDDGEYVYFNGEINEDAEVSLAELPKHLESTCVFNMKHVTSINSCGVRAWINFLREAEKSRNITFEECPPEIVSQINMIPNFRGKSHIRSVFASYVCENCDSQHLQLFTEGENLPTSPDEEVPEITCQKCGETMEMEELENEFFSWLDHAK
ncbi:MAG: hypothetical protein H6618_02450 [Deltaproteobacteria bacterium]|nr:hypothetical protein [Deltaproteobacteria bacterium]